MRLHNKRRKTVFARRVLRSDPSTRKQLLKYAKTLLAHAEAGDREAAEVLVDVTSQAGHEDAAETLLLSLQGRGRPPYTSNIPIDKTDALRRVRRELFPPRAAPCLPNKNDLIRLVKTSKVNDELVVLRELKKLLDWACKINTRRVVEQALSGANRMLRGHGVEFVRVPTRRGPENLSFEYINLGDTYISTLVYDHYAGRFRVISWGDMLETWERRYGEPRE